MLDDMLGECCAAVSLANFLLKLGDADFDNGKLRRDQKSVREDEEENEDDIPKNLRQHGGDVLIWANAWI